MKTITKLVNSDEEFLKILSNKVLIVDANIAKYHPFVLKHKSIYVINNPESNKNEEGLFKILRFFQEKELTRHSHVVALGGGALSDLVGFACSIFKRGIPFSIAPTTILSLIDASIGGKTGINTSFGKNIIGTFYLPKDIFIFYPFLDSLTKKDLDSGHGELLKYAFLSKKIYNLVSNKKLKEAYLEASLFKQKIIKKDFLENKERKVLNLGHTIGHPIESIFKFPHGVSVALGLKFILTIYNEKILENYFELTEKLNLILPDFNLNLDEFLKYLRQDKKRVGEDIEIIIPSKKGKSEIRKISYREFELDVIRELSKYS